MSEEIKEEKKTKKTFGWLKNIISAIAGLVIGVASTLGIVGPSDAELAKQKVESWLNKSEVVYVQVDTVSKTIAEVKELIKEKKYLEALSKLDTIKDATGTAITTIKELKDEIMEAAKAIAEEAKEKGEEVKETVQEGVEQVKDAINDKPAEAEPATAE